MYIKATIGHAYNVVRRWRNGEPVKSIGIGMLILLGLAKLDADDQYPDMYEAWNSMWGDYPFSAWVHGYSYNVSLFSVEDICNAHRFDIAVWLVMQHDDDVSALIAAASHPEAIEYLHDKRADIDEKIAQIREKQEEVECSL